MYFLHAINSDRQTRLMNVLGQIAMIPGDKKMKDVPRLLSKVYQSCLKGESGRGVMLTSHLHLPPTLIMNGAKRAQISQIYLNFLESQ